MNEDDKIFQRGPFKGKRIEFAPTTRIDMFWEIAEDLMRQILGFELSVRELYGNGRSCRFFDQCRYGTIV